MTTQQIAIFGASSAIAEQVARQYAAQGAELFLFVRSREKGQSIAEDCTVRGASVVHVHEGDLADTSLHAGQIASLRQAAPRLSRVLIAYGTLPDQEKIQDDYQCIYEAFQVNALSVMSLVTALVRTQPTDQKLSLGVITSVAGDRGRKSNYIYGAAKGALSLFLQGIRNRLSGSHIRIIDFRPGFVDTPMTAHIKKGPLFASAERVATGIVKSLEGNGDIVYLPRFWQGIMFIIRSIPEPVFKRLSI